MGRAMMIGGVFLLARDPRALADWYRRHLGWELDYISEEDTYCIARPIAQSNCSTSCTRSCQGIQVRPAEVTS